jgi:hypothetical protein
LREAQGQFATKFHQEKGTLSCTWGCRSMGTAWHNSASSDEDDCDDDGGESACNTRHAEVFDLHNTACFPGRMSMKLAIRNNFQRLTERCKLGATALHYAVAHEHHHHIRLLMTAKADPNAEWISPTHQMDSLTPLHLACQMGASKTIRTLLDQGKPAMRVFLSMRRLPPELERRICELVSGGLERPNVNAVGGIDQGDTPLTLVLKSHSAVTPWEDARFLRRCGARVCVGHLSALVVAERRAYTFQRKSTFRKQLLKLRDEMQTEKPQGRGSVKRRHPPLIFHHRRHRFRWR